jgi:uncharacterized membrane protein YjfL (UPF0719 family)
MLYQIEPWMLVILTINMLVAVASIASFRYLLGLLAGVNTTDELSKKDNYAFGTVFAGGAIALGLVLSAAVNGDAEASFVREIINILTYAFAGVALLKIGAQINEFVIFHKFSLKDEIHNENKAIGIVQAANFVALGIIINAIMAWVDAEDWTGLAAAAMAFFSTQVVLLAVTRARAFIYSRRHPGEFLQMALKGGNQALAIRYAGHLLGSALAFSAAGHMVEYIHVTPFTSAVWWSAVSVGLSFVTTFFAFIARKAILQSIDVVEEVDNQQNIGIALVEAAIFIVIGLLIISVLA